MMQGEDTWTEPLRFDPDRFMVEGGRSELGNIRIRSFKK